MNGCIICGGWVSDLVGRRGVAVRGRWGSRGGLLWAPIASCRGVETHLLHLPRCLRGATSQVFHQIIPTVKLSLMSILRGERGWSDGGRDGGGGGGG